MAELVRGCYATRKRKAATHKRRNLPHATAGHKTSATIDPSRPAERSTCWVVIKGVSAGAENDNSLIPSWKRGSRFGADRRGMRGRTGLVLNPGVLSIGRHRAAKPVGTLGAREHRIGPPRQPEIFPVPSPRVACSTRGWASCLDDLDRKVRSLRVAGSLRVCHSVPGASRKLVPQSASRISPLPPAGSPARQSGIADRLE
jgi:hypothetical protein